MGRAITEYRKNPDIAIRPERIEEFVSRGARQNPSDGGSRRSTPRPVMMSPPTSQKTLADRQSAALSFRDWSQMPEEQQRRTPLFSQSATPLQRQHRHPRARRGPGSDASGSSGGTRDARDVAVDCTPSPPLIRSNSPARNPTQGDVPSDVYHQLRAPERPEGILEQQAAQTPSYVEEAERCLQRLEPDNCRAVDISRLMDLEETLLRSYLTVRAEIRERIRRNAANFSAQSTSSREAEPSADAGSSRQHIL